MKSADINKYIGSRIRYYRKLRDWTQTRLGTEINVSFQQIQKYEKGVNSVSFPKLVDICNALDVSLNDILGDLLNNKKSKGGSGGGHGGSDNGGKKVGVVGFGVHDKLNKTSGVCKRVEVPHIKRIIHRRIVATRVLRVWIKSGNRISLKSV